MSKERTNGLYRVQINFSIVLGENIADNGGLKLSYRAYEQHKAKSIGLNENLRLPGLPYSEDQLFFISFAYVTLFFLLLVVDPSSLLFRVGVISKLVMRCITILLMIHIRHRDFEFSVQCRIVLNLPKHFHVHQMQK